MNVYDFDDTIYDGESALDFFFYYLKRRHSMARYIPKVLFAMLRYKLGLISTDKMTEEYEPILTEIFSLCDDVNLEVSRFWDEHIHKIKSFYEKIRKDDDIILTASPDVTMEELVRRLGVKNLVCSKIDLKAGKLTRLCMRENKIKCLYDDFGDVEIDDFYTDSMANDKYIAAKAKHVFVVKGDKITKIR